MTNARGRPGPPGRPRNSQVRSASSYSLQPEQQDELSRSPLSSSNPVLVNHIGITEHDGDEADTQMTTSTTARGLGLDLASEVATANAHEIPLEDVEHALRDLTRDDLVLALKRAKEQMDILDNKLEAYIERSESLEAALGDYATQVTTLEDDKQGLEFALTHREERIDEMMQEQERMEQEIYRKAQVNERLRKQLDESERVRVDTEKRYAEQSATSDMERQSYLDMEKLLQTQKAKAAATLERTQSANHQLSKQNDRLQQKVVHMQQRASPLRPKGPLGTEKTEEGVDSSGAEDDRDSVASSDPGSKVVRSLEADDRLSELQQELETMRSSQATLTATLQHLQTELRDTKAANVDLRTQNETFVDLLQEKTINGELITESAMLNRKYSTIGEESDVSSSEETDATETETSEVDDEDDVPDVPKKRNRGKSQRRDSDVQLHNDLASELETSDPQTTGRREARHREKTRERSEVLSSNVEELQKEIWELRDANQALTLYVNKILDRIISREGYENVLAVDGDHKRTLRGKASRLRPHASPGASSEPKLASPPRTNRMSGMNLLGLRRPDEEPLSPVSPTTPTAAKSTSAQIKARRVSAMDWRSFFPSVGGIATMSSTSPNPATDAVGVIGEARKIRSSEEKEDKSDEEERERIRQQLLREGIVLPEHQLKSQPQQSKRTSGIGTFFSRVLGAAEATPVTTANDPTTVKKGEQHPGPRVITFDGHGRAAVRSPLGIGTSTAQSDAGSNSESGSLTKADLRQRALELGGSGNLTEAPARRAVLDGRRSGRRSAGGSSSGGGNNANNAALSPSLSRTSDRSSRGVSEAGDESYFYQSGRGDTMSSSPSVSPSMHASANLSSGPTNAETEAPGWRKALKRMSLLSGASAVADASTPPE